MKALIPFEIDLDGLIGLEYCKILSDLGYGRHDMSYWVSTDGHEWRLYCGDDPDALISVPVFRRWDFIGDTDLSELNAQRLWRSHEVDPYGKKFSHLQLKFFQHAVETIDGLRVLNPSEVSCGEYIERHCSPPLPDATQASVDSAVDIDVKHILTNLMRSIPFRTHHLDLEKSGIVCQQAWEYHRHAALDSKNIVKYIEDSIDKLQIKKPD